MHEAEQHKTPQEPLRLADAVKQVKSAAADRADVLTDIREVSRMRLELLAQELTPVMAEIPKEDTVFDLAISSGQNPRLWIDAVAHVALGQDRRTYRLLRDTRMGRIVLGETPDAVAMADHVTRYIAERLVERRRFLEGEVLPLRPDGAQGLPPPPAVTVKPLAGGVLGMTLLVLLGGIAGAAGLAVALWSRMPELHGYLDRAWGFIDFLIQ